MPPNIRPPSSPFDNPAQYNKTVAARRAAEAAAARQESDLASQAHFQEAQASSGGINPEFPPGFALPQPPQVGQSTPGTYPQGRFVVPSPPQHQEDFSDPRARNERPMTQEEADLLDELAAHRAAAREAAQSQRPAVKPQNPKNKIKAKHVAVNPLLQQLRLDFGLDTLKTIKLTIADHVWSFYPLSPEMTALALRIAEMGSSADTERELLQQYAAVCCSVVAIDDEPIWKLFNLEPENGDDVSHPMNPKGRIRQRAALALLQELMTNTKLGVMQSLIEAYHAEVDPTGAVKGYTEYRNETYFRFTCPVPDCKFHIVRSKRFDTASNELAYFCEIHGEALESSQLDKPLEGQDPLA